MGLIPTQKIVALDGAEISICPKGPTCGVLLAALKFFCIALDIIRGYETTVLPSEFEVVLWRVLLVFVHRVSCDSIFHPLCFQKQNSL